MKDEKEMMKADGPFLPPNRPSATAAGFFPSSTGFGSPSVVTWTISAASFLRSLGRFLERSGMGTVSHIHEVLSCDKFTHVKRASNKNGADAMAGPAVEILMGIHEWVCSP